jgi:hypothetical protein
VGLNQHDEGQQNIERSTRRSGSCADSTRPQYSIAAYVGALWALGLSDGLTRIGDPELDTEGKALEGLRTPKTAGKRKKPLDNDF